MGVTFFFILSGFILNHSYARRLLEEKTSCRDFFLARIARIFPLHLLTLVIALPITIFGSTKISGTLAASLTANIALVQAFVPDVAWHFSFNSPSWSLSVEMFFYALFPSLILLRNRWLWTLVAVTILAKFALPADHFLQYIFPPLRLADFTLGILLQRWFMRQGPVSDRFATLAQTTSVLGLAVFIVFASGIQQWARYDIYYLLPMAGLVLSFAWQNGALANAISKRGWLLLGEASFALYLIHSLIIRYGEKIRSTMFPGMHPVADLVVAVAYIAASVTISIILFKFYEVPAKRFVLSRLTRLQLPGRVPALNKSE